MPDLTLDQVEAIAREGHARQRDKAGRPYLEHVQAVVEGVRERGGSDEQVAAAWLHDTIEDEVLSREWLESAELPQDVKDLVDAMTKRPGEDDESYTQRILATPGARLIKEADLAHNANADRLALLDEPTRTQLVEKYARMRRLLGLQEP
ncbi:HD domain-containing protein [Streptomyces sp. SLBN-118]|uniref:HD domain-containing protein n=1 Tax=Streptomyces sp. SLBN-118 TaxID=2768454 RepID=UPI00114FE177|nr:HD domain-containing protein [Streptomyces sp. SLBN-118]TQK42419.1 HD domain-containing protein [Streptomyces sp. SLBN-118]